MQYLQAKKGFRYLLASLGVVVLGILASIVLLLVFPNQVYIGLMVAFGVICIAGLIELYGFYSASEDCPVFKKAFWNQSGIFILYCVCVTIVGLAPNSDANWLIWVLFIFDMVSMVWTMFVVKYVTDGCYFLTQSDRVKRLGNIVIKIMIAVVALYVVFIFLSALHVDFAYISYTISYSLYFVFSICYMLLIFHSYESIK